MFKGVKMNKKKINLVAYLVGFFPAIFIILVLSFFAFSWGIPWWQSSIISVISLLVGVWAYCAGQTRLGWLIKYGHEKGRRKGEEKEMNG